MSERDAWLRLTDLLVEDLAEMSDEELVAELNEDGIDVHAAAQKIRDRIATALSCRRNPEEPA